MTDFNPENIPSEMRTRRQWIVWQAKEEAKADGEVRINKIPKKVDGGAAATDDPSTWTTFDAAVAAWKKHPRKFAGVGYVFSANDPFTGIDLDGCLTSGGVVEDWAHVWLNKMPGAAVEVSPSGGGMHAIVRAKLPGDGINATESHKGVELYDRLRYFCITGLSVGAVPDVIPEHQEAVDLLYAWAKAEQAKQQAAKRAASAPPKAKEGGEAWVMRVGGESWSPEERARAYIDRIDPGRSGDKGSWPMLRAACICVEFGLDRDACYRVLTEVYCPKCDPPWTDDRQIWHKIDDAFKKAEPGKKLREDRLRGGFAGFAGASPQVNPNFKGDPLPIEATLAPVPKLDPVMIPEPFRVWLTDAADRPSLAVEYPMSAAIVSVGAVLGRRLVVKPKRFDNWYVVPNVWGGACGKPGVMKTHAAEEGLKPLHRLAHEAWERHEAAVKAHAGTLLVLDAQVDAKKAELKKLAKMGATQSELEAVAAEVATMAEAAEPPKARRYIVNDATVEKLGELLAENPTGLTVFRDELVGFLKAMDKQGHEGDRQFYLESWNGLGSYTYDRIGRGTVFIPNTTLSLYGGIQPGPLARYIRGASGGDGADGLVQRFQLLVYPDTCEYKGVDRAPDVEAKNRAFGVYRTLNRLDPDADGIPFDPDKNVHFLSFASDAQDFFDAWYGDLETRLRSGREDDRFRSHLSKYRSLMPALALIFHMIDQHDAGQIGPIPLGTAQLAAAWCDFLEAHARRIYQSAMDGDVESATNLANRIKASLPNPFTFREVAKKGWSGLGTDEDVRKAVGILEDRGWVQVVEIPPGPQGGRPSEKVWNNPALLTVAVKEAS
jgi:putative DNA primase/helicase